MSSDQAAAASAWSPLRQPLFRMLWIAAVASNVGTWMQDTGGAWLMTSLAPSPLLVALMQTATSLPIFLLALPAGALADVVDRRRLLLGTQSWMVAAAAALGVLTLLGVTTPSVLLVLTFALGLGAALNAPAWQAIVPELVSRAELPAAVALNSVAYNLARAVGPALGGFVVAALGPGAAFLLNAASFVGVIGVLYHWKRAPRASVLPAEHITGAIRAGVRYVRHAPALRAVVVRTSVFIVCGSALWALLPLLARRELGLSAVGYGILLGCLGCGAVLAATILPRLQRMASVDLLVGAATVLFAAVTATLSAVRQLGVLYAAMVLGGVAWMTIMSSFTVAAQVSVPAWVRARAIAVYLLVFQGGMAAGSALWGGVAARVGIPLALRWAALGLLAGLAAALHYRLAAGEKLDLAPSLHWPEPILAIEPRPEQGPILITVEYRIAPERWRDFAEAMRAMRLIRRRDGAVRWGLFGDAAEAGRFVETFVVESWAEHLRQHERMTIADRVIEDRVYAFHIGATPPLVSHLISAYSMEMESA